MPRSEEANIRIREERLHRILSAALKVFAHKGLPDTRIADATGMSQGQSIATLPGKKRSSRPLLRA